MSYTLLQRLDTETARLFEMENRGKEIPTLESLFTFVRDRIKVLSRTGDNTNKITASARGNKNSLNVTTKNNPRAFVVNNNKSACPLCDKSDHDKLYSCPKFKSLTPRERYNNIKKLRACVNCLSLQHNTNNCRSSSSCKHCGKNNHHTLLHFDNTIDRNSENEGKQALTHLRDDNTPYSPGCNGPKNSASTNMISDKQVNKSVPFCSISASNKNTRKPHSVLLGTALADFKCKDGSIAQVRILIDSGSQNHFLTRRACKRLGIRFYNDCTERSVNGIGNSSQTISGITNITLHSRYDKTFNLSIQPLVINTISGDLPSYEFDISSLNYLNNIQLADPLFQYPADVDILLGAEAFMEVLRPGRIIGPPGKPDVLESAFGYLVIGSISALPCYNNNPPRNNNQTFFTSSEEGIETLVSKFLQLESVPTATYISKADQECEDFYVSNTHRDIESGCYVTALPFAQPTSLLGDSLTTATRRFSSLQRRFETNPALKIECDR